MADKKISELDSVLQINNDAEFPMSQDNAGEPTTFKVRITQIGTEIAEDMTFSNLQTTSKKLVGAINELLSLGSPIIIGTTAPTSSVGANGNLYIQYTAGTGGADDTVDNIYVKIDGAWCEIETGGGSASILYGTSAPTAQQGSNGNLYVQYTEGTGGASDTVDALFVKLDGAWCQISTGSGASSADQVSFDDTNVAFEADDVQEAFENITKYLTWAEYQALSSAEKNNGTAYFITDVNGDMQDFQPVIYSEEEREIGVWIDGKPLYQKTIKFTAPGTRDYTRQSFGVTVDYVTIIEATVIKNGQVGIFNGDYDGSPANDEWQGFISKSNSSLDYRVGANYLNGDCTLTIQYTKTTDTAGSGTWTPQGVPAVHYSEDEQVIGTWIDGSALYEKTIQFQNAITLSMNTWTNLVDVSALRINNLVSATAQAQTSLSVMSPYARVENGMLQAFLPFNWYISLVTIRYTKSSS